MRERLLLVFGSLVLVVIALYGIPRAYYLAEGVQRVEAQQLERTADLLEALIPEQPGTASIDDAFLESIVEQAVRIEHLDAAGDPIAVAGEPVDTAGGEFTAIRELPDGELLTISRSAEAVQQRLTTTLMPIVLLGLGLSVLAGAVCLILANKMSRPFQELAHTARELGGGRFDIADHDYPLPEAQAIGDALRQSALQLKLLLDREREFAANASHQLRTPITALRLELEDLTYWPETAPEVAAELNHALGELDRLGSAVTELLDIARGQRLGDARLTSIDGLLQASAKRWSRQAATEGRSIAVVADPEQTAVLHEGPVAQIFDVLIENSLTHGRGTVELRAQHAGTHLRLSVADEGPRPQRRDLFERRVTRGSGEGIGLAVASELALAASGTLRLESGPTTCFVLMLPLSQDRIPATAEISSGAE